MSLAAGPNERPSHPHLPLRRHADHLLIRVSYFRTPGTAACLPRYPYISHLNEIEAIRNSDIETTLSFIEQQRAFLREHLGAWVFDFADSIEEKAETGFYRNLAKVTRLFIRQDISELSDLDTFELNNEIPAHMLNTN